MEADDKKRMARRILAEYPEQVAAMLVFIDRYPSLQETPAQFQERCGQIALSCFWKDKQRASSRPVVPAAERGNRVEVEPGCWSLLSSVWMNN
jgi:hypothetical protein